jgi:hypothetical protein
MLELLKSQKKEGEDETEDTSETAVSKLPNLEVSSLAKPLNITSSVSLVPVKKPAESGQKKGKGMHRFYYYFKGHCSRYG